MLLPLRGGIAVAGAALADQSIDRPQFAPQNRAARVAEERKRAAAVRAAKTPGGLDVGYGSQNKAAQQKSVPKQGLTLVHFSAQPEPFLTRNTP